MKRKSALVLIFLIIVSSLGSNFAFSTFQIVFDPEGGFESEISEFTYGQKSFYSNYTQRFYVFGNDNRRIGGWDNAAWRSLDGNNWSNITYINIPVGTGYERLAASRIDFYLEPNGRYLHFARIDTDPNPNVLYYGKLELRRDSVQPIYVNATDEQQIDTAWGAYEVNTYVSVVADASGRPWVTAQYTTGAGLDEAVLLRCDQTNGTWISHTDISFQAVYQNVIDELIRPKLVPTGDNRTENGIGNGVHWIVEYDTVLGIGTRFVHVSGVFYDDNSGWDWDQLDINDLVEADWQEDTWSVGYAGNYTILLKQTEDQIAPNRITLSYQVREGKNNWENETQVAFDVAGDAGSVRFIPLCALNYQKYGVFAWTIQTPSNNTWWYRLGNIKNQSWQTPVVEWQDVPTSFTGDPNVAQTTRGLGYLGDGVPMSIGVADNTGSDNIYHDYLFAFGDGFTLPAEHLNTTLYDWRGNEVDTWVYEGEVYTLESYIENATSFYVNTTDSRHEILFRWDNVTQQQWIEVDPNDQFTIGLPHTEFERFGNITRLLWRFIPDRSIIDSEDNVWRYTIFNGNVTIPYNASAALGFTTNIYNLGGFTYYTFTGDGQRVEGGHPFEIQATNGTANGYARAEQFYRKLQHIHFLIEIDLGTEWDAVNGDFEFRLAESIDIGIDYLLNGSWREGWFVRLTIAEANVGHHNLGNDHNWIKWNVQWFNYNRSLGAWNAKRTDQIFTNFWGYENEQLSPDYHNRTSTQVWVDLWFDNTNASTTVAGQVNAMYHGMREHGSAWWFGYGVFQPMRSDEGNSQFLDELYDETGNVTDSLRYDLMRVFVEIDKDPDADSDDDTVRIAAVENMNIKQAEDRMQGIDQPSFEDTLVLDMPMFQSNNPIIRAIEGLSRSIWMGALSFQKIAWGALDSFFAWAGFGDGFFSSITYFIMLMPELIERIMLSMGDVMLALIDLTDYSLRLIVTILPDFIIGVGWLAESVIVYWETFAGFLNGDRTALNILYEFQLGDWISFGLRMLPAYELFSICYAKRPMRFAKRRIKFYTGIFEGVYKFTMRFVEFMKGAISVIMDIIPG